MSVEPGKQLTQLRSADPKQILQRYLSDESTKTIAADFGVTRQALGQFLLKHAEEDWKEAQVARALARKESAEDDLEAARTELIQLRLGDDAQRTAAATQLSLARVRACEASLKAAQWDLERVCKRIYGQDQPQQLGTVVINMVQLRDKPLDIVGEQVDAGISSTQLTDTQ